MKLRLIPFALLVFLMASAMGEKLWSQQTAPAPSTSTPTATGSRLPSPPPPYCHKKAPGMSQWTIRYEDFASRESSEATAGAGAQTKPGPRQIREVRVVRTKALRLVTVTYSDGEQDQLWADGMCFIEKDAGSPPTLTNVGVVPDGLMQEYQLSDFPDFAWISKDNYVDTVQLEQRKCLMFRASKPSGGTHPSTSTPETSSPAPQPARDQESVTAWIDIATKLPVQWSEGTRLRKITFESPPGELLVFPPEIARIAERMHKLQSIISPGR